MSYVLAAPEMMTSAATDLATIGSDLSGAHTAAAAPTVGLVPAAADEVSASVAHLFSQHAGAYQALAGQAAAFHEQFVQNLKSSAASFVGIEETIALLLKNFTPANIEADLTAFLKNSSTFASGLYSLFLQNPVQFLLGLLYIPVELLLLLVALPFLPFIAVLAVA